MADHERKLTATKGFPPASCGFTKPSIEPTQDAFAFTRMSSGPDPGCARQPGFFDREIDIRLAARRDLGNDLAGGRIDGVKGSAGLGGARLGIDYCAGGRRQAFGQALVLITR
jgi:hypothetical protein